MKKPIKIVSISLLSIIAAAILIVGGYLLYVVFQYYRIVDNIELEVVSPVQTEIRAGEDYTVVSYNLGFGAYSPEYSFFMDEGVMNDGTNVVGKYAKGMNKADVEKNIIGQMTVAKEQAADFYFFQEVDVDADRSYHINMYARARNELSDYSSVYAENFHTAKLLYPFNDPIGKTASAGILTLSKYKIDKAVRRSFPLSKSLLDKLFDLDRCFSVQRLPISGSDKQLVMINLHMSAYDEGGTVRAKQLEMLNAVLAEERAAGNYVIAGGDFNHCLIADQFDSDEAAQNHFPSGQVTPDWVKSSVLHNAELAEGFRIVADSGVSTCRGADIPYTPGVNYTTVIDGFVVSDNVTVNFEHTVDTQYAYSDHNPVILSFSLNG